MILSGGCLCGRVRYRILNRPGPLIYCHCSQCRKAQGTGFAANVPVPRASFELTEGANHIKGYQTSKDKTRYFCAKCSSPLYSYLREASNYRIRAGSLDYAPELLPSAHIFFTSKASWVSVNDDLPQFSQREPRQP
ncbi:MAG: hypothetical protein ACI915_001395 [Gammaproteobacteria bacterium]|jgi:hypothetical protein